jgi:AraC-like DNA-binding protein
MAVVFSTENVNPRERLNYWRDVMNVHTHEFTSSAGPAFLGSVSSARMGDLLVSEFVCDPCEVWRSEAHIRPSDSDDFLLCLQLSGKALFSQRDREAVNENGSFILLDPHRPFSARFLGETKSIRLTVPRQALESRLGTAAALSARTMDVGRPIAGLVSGFLSLLPSRIDAVDNATASRLAEQTLDLIALVFSLEADQAATLSSQRDVARYRLKAVIETRLCDPTLTPAAVAAAAGISVRYANDLLALDGFSVGRYVLHRRLERSRQALEDPAQARRTVGEIAYAWGFSDLSHFVRRFRGAYGLTPGDYRRRALERTATRASEGRAEEQELGKAGQLLRHRT